MLRSAPHGFTGSDRRIGGGAARRLVAIPLVLMLLLVSSLLVTSPAFAHAELRQASPGVGETVGGEFHSIAMQFFGLNENAPQVARLFDPAGNEIPSTLTREAQRLVIPIEPLTIPGEYTVTYELNSIDGDFVADSFTFRYQPDAPEPTGITIGSFEDEGFDIVSFVMLMVGAGIAAFIVHRFWTAWREHQAAHQVS